MPKLSPVSWKVLTKIFEADGFTLERQSGSHLVYSKPEVARPLIIPRYDEIGLDIIAANMRTAGMSRERYFEILNSL